MHLQFLFWEQGLPKHTLCNQAGYVLSGDVGCLNGAAIWKIASEMRRIDLNLRDTPTMPQRKYYPFVAWGAAAAGFPSFEG
jgi:hypothetical protein